MDEKLWSGPKNPSKEVANQLGMPRWQLRYRLHAIKEASGLSGTAHVIIWRSGRVTTEGGEDVGNLYDEN